MQQSSRGRRLARRYPVLAPVPEDERPAVVRKALRHPLLLLPTLAVALVALPPYFDFALRFLNVTAQPESIFDLGKIGCAILVPVIIAAPLLSRLVLPSFILREMKNRGY
ncbi:MAG: hypothetical protein LBH65_01735 [Desulfovibrio sp.]|jgi:hypothetical protein|nr:hypothetical protein [Desulfovibrio sp.]